MLRKIKEQVPKNFLIGVRISPEIEDIGISIDESIKLVKILKNEGVDFIHLSCWDVFKNSSMYIFTDGITEIKDPNGEMLGSIGFQNFVHLSSFLF